MKILCYGDSNTWGYVPNPNGDSQNAIVQRYPLEDCWWYPLTKKNEVVVKGLCGRCINHEDQNIPNSNASLDIVKIIKHSGDLDLIIIQLGTNDCKAEYNCSAKEITKGMKDFIELIKTNSSAKILLLSPPKINDKTPIATRHYLGGTLKSEQMDNLFQNLAEDLNIEFISGLGVEIGEDGGHLTKKGHKNMSQKVTEKVESMQKNISNKNDCDFSHSR